MKYHIITYGCQMNKSDSERIASVLENCGYNPALKENEADLIVINICSVRQSAVDRIFGLFPKFEKLKTKNYQLKTILTGCILKKDEKKFKKEFDLILNIKGLPNWPQHLKKSRYSLIRRSPNYRVCYLGIKPKYQNNFSAFIPVSNGCNNFCTYCVVPYTRGPLICRNHKEILKEVKNVVQRGFKEIWLLGQNVNRYRSIILKTKNPRLPCFARRRGRENPKVINFTKLLKMVNNIPGDFWIRFTSPHPKDFSDELIRAMAESEKFAHYLNLPVQSGNNEILKKMNRPYTIAQYKKLVKKIRKAIPDIALSTDVIVGFPTETKKQFQDTVKLLKEIKYDMAYIAKYSPRPGTAAVKMKDNVSKEEKGKRWKILTEILKKTALEKNKKFIGKEIEVLVEEERNGFLFGKTKNYKTIKFEGPKNLIGQFVKVKITNTLPWGLRGDILSFLQK